MYERSAIVLERYLDKMFGFYKEDSLKNSFSNFQELIEELDEYQCMLTEEEKIIKKFDDIAKEIQSIQKLQEKICLSNQKLEDERNKLFNSIDENPNIVQTKLEKIEETVDCNNKELKKIREEYIRAFVIFIERQKERIKCAREKREIELNHINIIKKVTKKFHAIPVDDVQKVKKFLNDDKQAIKVNIIDAMIRNGKNEKVGFNEKVINKAVDTRISIYEKEVECFLTVYEKLKKILNEIESDNIKLAKYKKLLKDTGVKLSFLNAQKNYIVEFLDNERITAMSGIKAHQKMMEEACENFELDIKQINNLYELILKEIAGKSTKKAYNELYNKSYLKDIQEKERNFEQELTNIKINMGAVINSNYWRIEGIKNVYEVFQKEVTEKFDKDLSEYKLEEIQEEFFESKQTNSIFSINNINYSKAENKFKYNDKYDDEYDDETEDGYQDEYDDETEDEYQDEYDDEIEDEYQNEYDDVEQDKYQNDEYQYENEEDDSYDYIDNYNENDDIFRQIDDEEDISDIISRINNSYKKNSKINISKGKKKNKQRDKVNKNSIKKLRKSYDNRGIINKFFNN